MPPDPFRSQRLLYRAFDSTTDDAFFTTLESDGLTNASAEASLLHPFTRAEIDELRDYIFMRCLLGVVICLSSPSQTSPTPPTPIGYIFLNRPAPNRAHHRATTFGIEILPSYRSHGYGSEAINWALDWGFRVAGLHRIGLSYFSWNVGAGRLYTRLGFVEEGRERKSLWYNGGWGDRIIMGMLDEEWWKRQGREGTTMIGDGAVK